MDEKSLLSTIKTNCVNKTISEASNFIQTFFNTDDDAPTVKVTSSDNNDFPIGIYCLVGYPNNWDNLIITDVTCEWINKEKFTKECVFSFKVNKTYTEVDKPVRRI